MRLKLCLLRAGGLNFAMADLGLGAPLSINTSATTSGSYPGHQRLIRDKLWVLPLADFRLNDVPFKASYFFKKNDSRTFSLE